MQEKNKRKMTNEIANDLIERLRKNATKKEPLKRTIFHKLAYIIEENKITEDILRQITNNDLTKQIQVRLLDSSLERSQKRNVTFPPFHVAPQEVYSLVKKIEELSNPYLDFANTPEEILAFNSLWQLNPGIDPKILEKNSLVSLLSAELAKQMLPEKEKHKRELETQLEQSNEKKYVVSLKRLNNMFKILADGSTEEDFKKAVEGIVNSQKDGYIKKRIEEEIEIKVEDLSDIVKLRLSLVERLKTEYVPIPMDKNLKEVFPKGSAIIIRDAGGKLIRGGIVDCICAPGDNHHAPLGGVKLSGREDCYKAPQEILLPLNNQKIYDALHIEGSEITTSKMFRRFDELVAKKLEQLVERINQEIKEDNGVETSPKADSSLNELVGRKVRVYPGRGEEYDFGGNTAMIPAGTEAKIVGIKSRADRTFYVKFPKITNRWGVTLREIKVVGSSFASYLAKSSADIESAQLICNLDYEGLAKRFLASETEIMRNDLAQTVKTIKYLNNFLKLE
jgi:hypothetical protein